MYMGYEGKETRGCILTNEFTQLLLQVCCFFERMNRNILSGSHGLFRKLLEAIVSSQRTQGPRRVSPTSKSSHIRANSNPLSKERFYEQ